MGRVVARWGFIPLVLVVVLAGIFVGRVIEAIAVACVVFAIGTWLRRLVPAT